MEKLDPEGLINLDFITGVQGKGIVRSMRPKIGQILLRINFQNLSKFSKGYSLNQQSGLEHTLFFGASSILTISKLNLRTTILIFNPFNSLSKRIMIKPLERCIHIIKQVNYVSWIVESETFGISFGINTILCWRVSP